MATMTDREVFDRVKSHLLTQGARSVSETGSCRYRGDGGLKCAAGVLISDELYHPGLEGQTVWHSTVIDALEASGVPVSALAMLTDLQELHDFGGEEEFDPPLEGRIPDLWPAGLDRIERKYFPAEESGTVP